MNRAVAQCIMVVATGAWLVLSLSTPSVLGDSANSFLKNFVNHEMLGFLGVVVTITLASAANLHIELNKLEERAGARVFIKTRARVHQSAYWLLGMLVIAILLVTAKPLAGTSDTTTSLFNGAALLISLFSILTLADLTKAAFTLGPSLPDE